MKKFNVLFAIFAVGLAVLFASCNPTTGLDQLSPDEVTSDWVKGTWEGTSTIKTQDSKSVTDIKLDYSNTISAGAGVIALKAIATTGNLYANMYRTKIVYYTYVTDKDGNTISTTTVSLTKK